MGYSKEKGVRPPLALDSSGLAGVVEDGEDPRGEGKSPGGRQWEESSGRQCTEGFMQMEMCRRLRRAGRRKIRIVRRCIQEENENARSIEMGMPISLS